MHESWITPETTDIVWESESSGDNLRCEVESALIGIRARVRGHAGDVVITDVKGGNIKLSFLGACRGCPAQAFTFLAVVEPALLKVKGVKSVVPPRMASSPAVLRRIRKMISSMHESDLSLT